MKRIYGIIVKIGLNVGDYKLAIYF